MSEAKHTQGPWRYVYAPGYCGELIAQDGTTIAEFVVEPSLDNAALLAAAPELLAALKEFAAYVHAEQCATDGAVNYSNTRIHYLAFKARAAIAQATNPQTGNQP